MPFSPDFPGFEVEVLELLVRIILRNVHGLADRRIHERRDRRDHAHVIERGDLQRGDEVRREALDVAAQMPVQPPGVILDVVDLVRAVGLRASCADRSRNTAARCRCSHCRRTRARSCRSARSTAGGCCAGRARGFPSSASPAGARRSAVLRGIRSASSSGNAPFSFAKRDGRGIGLVAHELGDLRAHRARVFGVVAQAEHDQRVAQAGEARARCGAWSCASAPAAAAARR